MPLRRAIPPAPLSSRATIRISSGTAAPPPRRRTASRSSRGPSPRVEIDALHASLARERAAAFESRRAALNGGASGGDLRQQQEHANQLDGPVDLAAELAAATQLDDASITPARAPEQDDATTNTAVLEIDGAARDDACEAPSPPSPQPHDDRLAATTLAAARAAARAAALAAALAAAARLRARGAGSQACAPHDFEPASRNEEDRHGGPTPSRATTAVPSWASGGPLVFRLLAGGGNPRLLFAAAEPVTAEERALANVLRCWARRDDATRRSAAAATAEPLPPCGTALLRNIGAVVPLSALVGSITAAAHNFSEYYCGSVGSITVVTKHGEYYFFQSDLTKRLATKHRSGGGGSV